MADPAEALCMVFAPLLFATKRTKCTFARQIAEETYLMDAKNGEIIFSKHIGCNFEASGIVIDDCIVILSRGNQIFKLRVK